MVRVSGRFGYEFQVGKGTSFRSVKIREKTLTFHTISIIMAKRRCFMKNELYLSHGYQPNLVEEIYKNDLKGKMIAYGKALARASKQMSLEEFKVFVMALTKINWKKDENNLEIYIQKNDVKDALGWNYDSSDLSYKLRLLIKNLLKHSMVSFDGETDEEWEEGFLVTNVKSTRGEICIKLNEYYRPLFEGLLQDKDYITIWANDVYGFKSVYSYLFFEELRLHCDTRTTNYREYSTKELKKMFGMPKDGKGSYMHFDKTKGKNVFDRTNFEKYVLDVICAEINNGSMIELFPQFEYDKDGKIKSHKYYKKIKKNGYVAAYRFQYNVKTRQTPTEEEIVEQLEGQYEICDLDCNMKMIGS